MLPPTLILIINAVFIIAGLILIGIIIRLGSRHAYYYGLADIQTPLMKRILGLLMILILLAFIATLFNFGITFWQQDAHASHKKTAPSASTERAV